jgi:DNA polymerase-3 subunit alpha (Gram-positive type)
MQEIFVDVYDFQEAHNKFKTIDREENKRVEFHVHTKMSSLDGINDASEYIKVAQE